MEQSPPFGGVVNLAGDEALVRIGPVALAALSKELESKNVNDRRLAVISITSFLGKNPIEKIRPSLVLALKDEDKLVRKKALTQIMAYQGRKDEFFTGLTAPEKQAYASALALVVSDPSSSARELAVATLGDLTTESATAVPVLVKVLASQQENSKLRISAARALSKLGPSAKVSVPASFNY